MGDQEEMTTGVETDDSVVAPQDSGTETEEITLAYLEAKEQEAKDRYLDASTKYGAEHSITTFYFQVFALYFSAKKYKIYTDKLIEVLPSAEIKEELSALFLDVFKEVSVFETESYAMIGDPTYFTRFSENIGKYPRFMRNFIVRRRAKKYYNDMIKQTRSKIGTLDQRISALLQGPDATPEMIEAFNDAMRSIAMGSGLE